MDIAAQVNEFQSLIGGYIRKAYQPAREIVVIRINVKDGRRNLVIRTGKAFYLTTKGPENPPQPTGFAMMLRKHVTNGRIVSIEQQEFDRIITIGIQKEEFFQLVIEGFGDGNVILVKDGVIVQPLISRSWRHRIVRARHEYAVPPSLENPRTMDFEVFEPIITGSEKDLVRTLASQVNLGGRYAEELCLLSGLEKDHPCSSLDRKAIEDLYHEMNGLFRKLESPEPGTVWDGDHPIEALPFPLESLKGLEYRKRESYNEAAEEYFTHIAEVADDQERSAVNPAIARIERTIIQQQESIERFENEIEVSKEKAERLFLRYQEFERALEDIRGFGEKHGWTEMAIVLKKNKKTLDVNLEEKFVVMDDEANPIKLYFMETVNENASRYYENAGRAREKLKGAKEALDESLARLEKAKKEAVREEKKSRTERKVFWFERYRWFISSDGNVVVGGKDARSNDRVVKKYLKERDLYVHAEIHGAPSLVIKSRSGKEDEIAQQTKEEACIYAACFSRAWSAGIGSVEAYWVNQDQVSKTPGAGEFLAKGAFVIRGRRNRIQAPLRLAIGKINWEGTDMIMCGPIPSITAQTDSYLILEPGGLDKNSFATRLARSLDVKNEEILSIIPGNVRIAGINNLEWND